MAPSRRSRIWRTKPPIGSLLLPEDCLGFNPDNLAIVANGTLRIIKDGGHALFAFPDLQEATTALNILKQYRADKSCFIGRPDPSFQYLLVNNESPEGPSSGEDCVGFDPPIITLEPLSDGRYQMLSGTHAMFVFPDMLEAGNALSVIRKYGFSRSCFVGRPDPSLQYMRADIHPTGRFDLSPAEAAVAVHEPLNYAFTWTVPAPRDWHDLQSLQLRIRDSGETIFWVLFDEATQTFSLVDEASGLFGQGSAAGSHKRLQTSQATLDLAGTSVVGSGPTGPRVTLNLALSFKPQAGDRTFLVEVAESDDLGNKDDFAVAGRLTVSLKKGSAPNNLER